MIPAWLLPALPTAAAALVALVVGAQPLSADIVPVEVIRVVDGDTLHVALPSGRVETVRLQGFDTPEVGRNAECQAERMLGQLATTVLRGTLDKSALTLKTEWETDRWGRLLATGLLDENVELADVMIGVGIALPYDRRGPRPDWCAR